MKNGKANNMITKTVRVPDDICPDCRKEFKSNFDIFSIKNRGRCVDCHKVWADRPENDPDLKAFDVNWIQEQHGTYRIYAKNTEEAREIFFDKIAEGDEEIDSIDYIKREGFGEINENLQN